MRAYFERIAADVTPEPRMTTPLKNLEVIARWCRPAPACWTWAAAAALLLAYLMRERGCTGYGIELDDANVLASTQRGINVIQLNLEEG
jgi:hypothetical protein